MSRQPQPRPAAKSRAGLVIATAAAGALLFGGSAIVLFGHTAPPPAAVGGHYELAAPDGTAVSDATFHGKYVLIYFGYTSCADVCPATLNNVAAALAQLGDRAAMVQPVFITLDPARDTPPVLRRYTAAFTPALLGLTGGPATLQRVAADFHVYSAAAGHGRLDHSSVLYLMDRTGQFLAPIRSDATASEMARQLRSYVVK